VTYKCERSRTGSDGWISKVFFFELDQTKNTALVLDGYTHEYMGGVIKADSYENREDRHRIKWTVNNIVVGNLNTTLPQAKYSATILKKNLKLRVHVNLIAYDNQPYGEGKCTIYKGR
jgi:hypothetical protein